MKSNYAAFRTVSQLVFILAAFVLSVMVANGFKLTFDGLTWEFAVDVLVKLSFTLLAYNLVFSMDNGNRRQAPRKGDIPSKYFRTLITNKMRVEHIYKNKKIPELEEELKKYNDELYKKACNRLIRRQTTRLSYEDIDFTLGSEGIRESLKDKFRMTDKAMGRLMKVVEKIQNGAVKYERVEIDDVLFDNDEKGDKAPSMIFNATTFLLKQNIIKAITFMLTTILMSIVSFTQGDTDIWQALLKNSTLLLGATVSAITLSHNYIKLRTIAFEQRNDFFLSRMGIDIEYRPA